MILVKEPTYKGASIPLGKSSLMTPLPPKDGQPRLSMHRHFMKYCPAPYGNGSNMALFSLCDWDITGVPLGYLVWSPDNGWKPVSAKNAEQPTPGEALGEFTSFEQAFDIVWRAGLELARRKTVLGLDSIYDDAPKDYVPGSNTPFNTYVYANVDATTWTIVGDKLIPEMTTTTKNIKVMKKDGKYTIGFDFSSL